jgi:hypothetical protein
MFYNLLDLIIWGRKSRTYKRWIYGKRRRGSHSKDNIDSCWMCESVFAPKAIAAGVHQLQTFKGYTVDFRLRQLRNMPLDDIPEFIDFESPDGIKLCTEMHEEAVKRLNRQIGKEVFISI